MIKTDLAIESMARIDNAATAIVRVVINIRLKKTGRTNEFARSISFIVMRSVKIIQMVVVRSI